MLGILVYDLLIIMTDRRVGLPTKPGNCDRLIDHAPFAPEDGQAVEAIVCRDREQAASRNTAVSTRRQAIVIGANGRPKDDKQWRKAQLK
jgi:hypothetical protein